MQEQIRLTGMVIKETPIGETDRRVTLLTRERGKISAFAHGARKQSSRLIASTGLFSFGEFTMYEGRSSYNLVDAAISNYFEGMRNDYDAAVYGMYFLEVTDYYTRENNDESDFLKLIYQSLKALLNKNLDNRLIRSVFEIKSMVIEGEFPGLPAEYMYSETAKYTVNFIVTQSVEKLYTFRVSEEVLSELASACRILQSRCIDRQFKSLEILPQV
jgi:DNA repair protein RecO (recombination protein O)